MSQYHRFRSGQRGAVRGSLDDTRPSSAGYAGRPMTPQRHFSKLWLSLLPMNRSAVRLCLIAALCLMSLNVATEVIRHPETKDHASSILGLGFCLVILIALVLLRPLVVVRVAA